MGQANSSPKKHAYHYPAVVAHEAAASKRSQALYRDRLRRPSGQDLPPATYRELQLDDLRTSDALRSQLAALGASTPSCFCSGKVPKKQARITNGRFTFNADSPGRHIAEIFTDHELDNLVADGDESRSREMPVFDREGRRYGFEFTYSEEHGYYRLAGPGAEFERFMVDNGVARDVLELDKKMTMQIFAFRSRKLLPKGKGFRDHPDGALGMIVLFSQDEDTASDWVELDDDEMTIKEMLEKYPAEPEGYRMISFC